VKLPFSKKKSESNLSRREIAARRQAKIYEDLPTQSYRRNRTLNSRQTISPLEASERLEAHELVKKRRSVARRLFMTAVGLAIIVSLLFQLTIDISIQTPDMKSSNSSKKYVATLNEYYSAHPAERFRFFLNNNDLKQFFLQKAPEVKNIRIEGDFLARSAVKLTFRQPVAQWSSGGKVYFVDDGGVTFEQNYFDAPAVVVRDESGLPTRGGQEVINRQFLSFLGQAVSAFAQYKIKVSEATLPASTVRQVWFKVEGRATQVRMTVDRSAQSQVKQAIIALEYLGKTGSVPEYIDVRVDQRSFYK
jgi:hypothetical protein